MMRKLTILILVLISAGVFAQKAFGYKLPLRDGFTVAGVDGRLTAADCNTAGEKWFFEPDSEIKDDRAVIEAGEKIELLPSATLEKMTADINDRTGRGCRIWGSVTEYNGKNFIFPVYFLSLGKIEETATAEKPRPEAEEEKQQEDSSTINEEDDAFAMPDEVLSRLSPKRIVSTPELKKGLELKADSILAGRTGRITVQTDGRAVFVLDSLGRNLPRVSLPLLPCQTLQYAERKQAAEPEPLRFKVSGIVTRYKGKNYLLLQQATRVYSHQNFSR